MHECGPRMGMLLLIILSQIWLSIEPIFTVLPIIPSFLVCFRPVKYRIEGLDVLFPMVRKWSIKSCFWPGHGLGQLRSTLVKLGQHGSNLYKPHKMCPQPCSGNFLMHLSYSQFDCLVLRANTLGNPEGKNKVMTTFTTFN